MLQATARIAALFLIALSVSTKIFAQSNCSNAPLITTAVDCSTQITADLEGAVNAAPTGSCGGATATTTNGVWYKFTATSTKATITLSGLSSPSNLTLATTYIE